MEPVGRPPVSLPFLTHPQTTDPKQRLRVPRVCRSFVLGGKTARNTGQIIRRGPQTRRVGIYVDRNPETRKPGNVGTAQDHSRRPAGPQAHINCILAEQDLRRKTRSRLEEEAALAYQAGLYPQEASFVGGHDLTERNA